MPNRLVASANGKNKALDAWLEAQGRPYEVRVTVKPADAPEGFVPVLLEDVRA